MTSILTVQVAPSIVPSLNVMLPAPGSAEIVGVPQPVVVRLVGEAITSAPGVVGKVSLKATLVSGCGAFALLIVNLSVEGAPSTTVDGVKILLIVVIALSTCSVALAVPVPLTSVEVTAPDVLV